MDNAENSEKSVNSDAAAAVADTGAQQEPGPGAAAIASATDLVVEEWFRRHFFNLGGGISEDLYNRIHSAKEDLKASLAGYIHP